MYVYVCVCMTTLSFSLSLSSFLTSLFSFLFFCFSFLLKGEFFVVFLLCVLFFPSPLFGVCVCDVFSYFFYFSLNNDWIFIRRILKCKKSLLFHILKVYSKKTQIKKIEIEIEIGIGNIINIKFHYQS